MAEDDLAESSSCEGSLEVIQSAECQSISNEHGKIEEKKQNGHVKEGKGDEEIYRWERSPYTSGCEDDFRTPKHISLMVKFAFTVMFFCGYLVDWLRAKGWIRMAVPMATEDEKYKGFAPLDNHFEAIYVNHIYRKSADVVNRPLCSVPGSIMTLKDRYSEDYGWTFKYTGKESRVVNLGSYNYLGFSHNDGPCADRAADYIDRYGIHFGATRHERGNHVVHKEMEGCIARYLGVEDAIAFPMGFGTNSMNIPSLVDKNSLILSDRLNHASIVLGCRMSGATIKTFKHNDAKDCEKTLRNALCEPSPKTGLPYNKVLIVIEGIYSMEGTIVNLPAFIEVKKKYGAYIFLDEAHSVGALGPTGKGVVEYWGCNPRDVDIMMGTLTKSFAAAGGYMGGAKSTIDHIRLMSSGPCYGSSLSPPIIAQVLSSMRIMQGEDGTNIGATKAIKLLRNSRYFRRRLRQMGFLVYGNDDSPVVPLMTFYITKVVDFSRQTLLRNVGLVAVGFPATPLTKARVRFCLSSDHTKQQLDYVLDVVNDVGDATNTKYGKKLYQGQTIEY